MSRHVGSDAAEEKARQCLVVTAAFGVGRAGSFVVYTNALTNNCERIRRCVMTEIPKANGEMSVVRPARLWKTARLEIADECFNFPDGGKHGRSLQGMRNDCYPKVREIH